MPCLYCCLRNQSRFPLLKIPFPFVFSLSSTLPPSLSCCISISACRLSSISTDRPTELSGIYRSLVELPKGSLIYEPHKVTPKSPTSDVARYRSSYLRLDIYQWHRHLLHGTLPLDIPRSQPPSRTQPSIGYALLADEITRSCQGPKRL